MFVSDAYMSECGCVSMGASRTRRMLSNNLKIAMSYASRFAQINNLYVVFIDFFNFFTALAIYVRSPAAYEALKGFGILTLPSVKSLQLFTSVRNHSPGINEEYIEEKGKENALFCDENISRGRKKPLGLGVLIYDEVKVMAKVMLNMKNEQFIGLAMSESEMTHLHDIYHCLASKDPVPAEYVLQFLWRDLTSKFDVIGPYYSLNSTINHHITIETLYETMRVFHNHGFKTNAIVCDGASCNLAPIKLLTTGKKGAYGVCNEREKHNVQPWFINPYDPTTYVYFVICPSHQVNFV